MKMDKQLTITGMKASKGEYEGVGFDSTKVYAMTDMDETKGNAKGFATVEYVFNKSDEYEKFKHLSFPFKADCELDFVTNGKVQKMILVGIKPIPAAGAVKA